LNLSHKVIKFEMKLNKVRCKRINLDNKIIKTKRKRLEARIN